MPKEKLDIKVTLDKISYKQGDEVKYQVDVVEAWTGKTPKGNVLISLLATDESAYLETDTKKLPASIPYQVYLSKDVKPTNDFEYLNANTYLDQFFSSKIDDDSKKKVDLLLGTQRWRLLKLDP